MEVTTVELSKFLELVLIENFYHAAMKLEHPVEPELAKDAVGVDAGHSHGFADLFLCQGHRKCIAGHASDHLKPLAQLDDDMRQTIVSGPLPDIDTPLPEHRCIHQRVPPEDVAGGRPGRMRSLIAA
jgi:hypothetical protein